MRFSPLTGVNSCPKIALLQRGSGFVGALCGLSAERLTRSPQPSARRSAPPCPPGGDQAATHTRTVPHRGAAGWGTSRDAVPGAAPRTAVRADTEAERRPPPHGPTTPRREPRQYLRTSRVRRRTPRGLRFVEMHPSTPILIAILALGLTPAGALGAPRMQPRRTRTSWRTSSSREPRRPRLPLHRPTPSASHGTLAANATARARIARERRIPEGQLRGRRSALVGHIPSRRRTDTPFVRAVRQLRWSNPSSPVRRRATQ